MEAFFEQNIVVVYFIYGLAFFSMGLMVWVESGRSSTLPLARALRPLAAFGILHGIHEWLEMFERFGGLVPAAPLLSQSPWLDAVRIALLAFSFLLLLALACVSSIRTSRKENVRIPLLSACSPCSFFCLRLA